MKLITRDTDYSVRALCFIARKKDELVPVTELVKMLGVPRPFLRKILQMLTKTGILKSHKGLGGGFRLARRPGEIFLVDLMKTFQGPMKLNECFLKKSICPKRRYCCLRKKIDKIEKGVLDELETITIEGLIKREG